MRTSRDQCARAWPESSGRRMSARLARERDGLTDCLKPGTLTTSCPGSVGCGKRPKPRSRVSGLACSAESRRGADQLLLASSRQHLRSSSIVSQLVPQSKVIPRRLVRLRCLRGANRGAYPKIEQDPTGVGGRQAPHEDIGMQLAPRSGVRGRGGVGLECARRSCITR